MNVRKLVYGFAAIALVVPVMALASPAAAQDTDDTTPTLGMPWGGNFWAVEACSTTDYAAVVAEALGTTPTALRQALAGGQSVSDLADAEGVTLDSVREALVAARGADVAAALEQGLITQAEADFLTSMNDLVGQFTPPGLGMRQGAPNQQGLGQNQSDQSDDRPFRLQIHMPDLDDVMLGLGFGFGPGFGIGGLGQPVKTYQVAATALNMSCADLVKAVQGGSSIAQEAAQAEGGLQAVTDALVAAHEEAIDTALSEGLISQVNADAAKADVLNRVLMEISRGDGGRWGFGRNVADGLGGMFDEMRERFGLGGGPGSRGGRGR